MYCVEKSYLLCWFETCYLEILLTFFFLFCPPPLARGSRKTSHHTSHGENRFANVLLSLLLFFLQRKSGESYLL